MPNTVPIRSDTPPRTAFRRFLPGSVAAPVVLAVAGGTLAGTWEGLGPPVLLLHAGRERKEVWSAVMGMLAARGHESVAYDLRGHGASVEDDAGGLASLAADVRAMVAEFDTAPVIVGASLGGLCALLALEDPSLRERVAGLVLVDVVPDPDPERSRAYLATRDLAEQPIVDDILDRGSQLRGIAAGLNMPVALVRGGERSPLHDADVRAFQALLPSVTVATVEPAGHLVARDAPDELATELAAYLCRPDVRRRRIGHLLSAAGAERLPHPGGSLRDHLDRTADMLESWGAEGWVVDAARLHAAYGTEGFPHPLGAITPGHVISAAGARAEHMVDLYSRCQRDRSYSSFLSPTPVIVDRNTSGTHHLSSSELAAFMELTIANELDVLTHSSEIRAAHGQQLAELFTAWQPHIGEAAAEALETALTTLGLQPRNR